MQKSWLHSPSPGKSAATLALSLCLLTGCFEEENKTQSETQESTASQVVETISGIDVPTAPENPLEQSDWTTDFLKPGEIIPPIVKPEIALPETSLPIDEGAGQSDVVEPVGPTRWFHPVIGEVEDPTNPYMSEDWVTYESTGHHLGVDYKANELQFCADGTIIEHGEHIGSKPGDLAYIIGNYFFLYVESVDKTFVYAHLKNSPEKKTGEQVKAGEACGIAGNTGSVSEGIHLHLECWNGKCSSANRQAAINLVKADKDITHITDKSQDPDCVLRHYISGKTNEPPCSWQEPEAAQPFGTSRTVGTSSLLDALHHENP